ncbi:MAG TPA: PrgI family protein [Candidatus Saccharimonadales bacterium]|jgi:hypothetical protein
MATYKVLQDIEAEDTLIGPLTLRQCIYAAIAVIAAYLTFISVAKGAAFMAIFLLPFVAFGAFFAFPWSKQQTTEVWALAKIRFYFKPRKRIWNQSGAKELVTITVPKAVKQAHISNLTPTEVTSRLKALADTIDSRGWAVKNVDPAYFMHSLVGSGQQASSSDRLIAPSSLPQDVPNYDTTATSDIFDTQNNPVAQKFDTMMAQAANQHRQQIVQQMAAQQPTGQIVPTQQPATASQQTSGLQQVATQPEYWHMHNVAPIEHAVVPNPAPLASLPGLAPNTPYPYDLTLPSPVYYPQSIVQPQQMPMAPAQPLVTQPAIISNYAHMRSPGVQATPLGSSQQTSQPPVTAIPSPVILDLANNNDLNVATIAREAQARSIGLNGEVVVSLHETK